MFGYILPEKSELKIREYEVFRAYYCGICKSIGERLGQIPRFTLNYDSAFLALLISTVLNEKAYIKLERCIVHPLHKRHVIRNSRAIDYAADMNIILAYYNIEDNWKDEKSAAAAAGRMLIRPGFKKLKKEYESKCVIIENRLKELDILEKGKCSLLDRVAEPFARLMEEVFACEILCKNKKIVRIMRWIGYNTGKWIYILDAYDDIKNDLDKKLYNPLLRQYNYNNEDIGNFKDRIKKQVEFVLIYTLNQIAKAYELLEVSTNCGILENIIYMGMLRNTEKIMDIGGCKKVEKSI